MIRLFLLSLFFCVSCSINYNPGVTHQKSERVPETVNYVNTDLTLPLEESVLIDHLRSINPSPLVINNTLIYSNKSGQVITFDLIDQKEITGKSFGFGTNISPLLSGNKLLLTSGVGRETLKVFHSTSGTLLWTKDISYGVESTPVIEDDAVYIAGADGKLYKLEMNGGKTSWEKQLRKPVHADLNVFSDLLLAIDDSGTLYAINKETGDNLWTVKSERGAVYTKPTIIGNNIIISTIDGYMYCVNLISRNIVWERLFEGPLYAPVSYDGKSMFVGCNNGMFYKLNIEGNIVWSFESKYPVSAQALIGNKHVYFGAGNGTFYILNKSDGKALYSREFKGRFIASPVFWKNNLIVFSDNDDVYLLSNQPSTKVAAHNE